MKRLRTWLIRLIALAIVLVTVVAVGWLVAGKRVAGWIITTRLEALGIEVTRLDVESAHLGRTSLGALELGPGSWLTVDTVTATYGLGQLLDGRLETLAITDALWTVRVSEGEVSWGLPNASEPTGDLLDLPLRRLDLERVGVRVVGDEETTEITLTGSVTRSGRSETTSDLQADFVVTSDAGRVPMSLHGVLDLSAGSGWLDFETPSFEIDDPAQLAMLLLGDRADDLQLGGVVKASGRVTYEDDALRGRFDLIVTDGLAVSETQRIEINGIDAALQIDLWPTVMRSLGPITFRTGQLGELPLTGGAVRVILDADQQVMIDELTWSMGDYGRFDASPFALDAGMSVLDTVIGVHDASLDPWLRLLSDGRARGDGHLFGQFEVVIDRRDPDHLFNFGEGLLEAQPASGWIAVGGEEIRKLMEASDPRFRDREFSKDVGDRIIAALEDFAFTVLRMQFVADNGSRMLRVELAGRGRQGANAIEVGSLTLNVRGFADYLYLAVMLGKEFNP